MKIILSNGTELTPIMVTGESKYIQGASRDSLSFVFDDSVSMDELDSLFSEANCESINIFGDDASEYLYKGYTIRAELKKADVVVEQATTDAEAVTVKRITVIMAQRTYAESKIASMQEEITNTQLALCEIYEGGVE